MAAHSQARFARAGTPAAMPILADDQFPLRVVCEEASDVPGLEFSVSDEGVRVFCF